MLLACILFYIQHPLFILSCVFDLSKSVCLSYISAFQILNSSVTIKHYRPRYKTVLTETSTNNVESVMKTWLDTTRKHLLANVKQLLQLIQNVQGLHLIKEESLKIGELKKYYCIIVY